MKKKSTAILLVILLVISLVGCSKNTEKSSTNESKEKSSNNTTKVDKEVEEVEEEFSYPMKEVKFTHWLELINVGQKVTNLGDTPFAAHLREQTGVEIEYQHPVQGQLNEQFSLLVASGDLPDLFEYNILRDYPGGPEKAIADGIIVDLTEYIPKFAPNLMKYYEENPEIAKLARTDTGKYYSFPFIRGDEPLMVFFGPVVNGQWLKDLGLEYPETMDEWHTMLTRFKNEKGATAPLTYEPWMLSTDNGSPFIGAFGIAKDFYLDEEGKVQYGSIQPEYKDFLETFTQWYAEGLLDLDIETMNREQVAAKLTNGQSGASIGYMASRMGTWLDAVADKDDLDFVGVKYPVVNKGDIPKFTQKDVAISGLGDVYISTKCKDIEAAVRYLDFGYSEMGNKVFNFGIEGVSYEMIDGYPTYTDFILNNPEMSPVEALGLHARANYQGPFVQVKEYIEQYGYKYNQQKEANDLWKISNVDKYRMPKITPTPEESQEIAIILSEINTYRDEMFVKYIMGVEALDSYETYVNNIKKMGIDRVIEIYEAALTRFNNR